MQSDNRTGIDLKTFYGNNKVRTYEVDEMSFVENDIDITDMGHLESLFALGNGYLGLRGTYDEVTEGEISGMYINGIFEKEPIHHPWPCKGYATHDQYTVNLCDWRIFEFYINGEKACNITNHRRVLDFASGAVVRTYELSVPTGQRASIKSTRIVNNSRPHSAEIQYVVTPLNFDGQISVVSRVIKNTPINGKMTTDTVSEKVSDGVLQLNTRTHLTRQDVSAAIIHKVDSDNYDGKTENNENEYIYTVTADVQKDRSITVEKYASFYSTEDDCDDLSDKAYDEAMGNKADGFAAIYEEQCDFWSSHWENGDIKIDGNSSDQQAVRLSLFHLKSQLPTINNASIGATGLTGANYSGKVFWDTEMYLMPYYLFTKPEDVKGLIMYRVKLLDKARERAEQIGNIGALYSWCSINGEETSVVFEASTAEYHINADIAYAVWRYEKATGDSEFVYENCVEMLFETAKFYAHRGSFVEAHDGRFCINSVCGPDEYACGVNNNCYTNFMVQFHLRYALDIYKRMQEKHQAELTAILNKTGIDKSELDLWQDAADKMYYKVNERYGIYEQDDRFVYNDAVDMNTIPKNFDIRAIFHPLDLWRMQVLKQADVVLLQFVLGDKFTAVEKKRNYDYYEPKTNHGSSLSAAVHSIMANEIGYYNDAYEYFKSSAYMDISDFKRNTTGGVHIACLGGVWMSVVNGFMGMRLYDNGLHFSPRLPKAWVSCTFRINYANTVIEVCADGDNTSFTLISGDSVSFFINDTNILLNQANKTVVM